MMTGLIRRVLAAELTAAELDEFIKFIAERQRRE